MKKYSMKKVYAGKHTQLQRCCFRFVSNWRKTKYGHWALYLKTRDSCAMKHATVRGATGVTLPQVNVFRLTAKLCHHTVTFSFADLGFLFGLQSMNQTTIHGTWIWGNNSQIPTTTSGTRFSRSETSRTRQVLTLWTIKKYVFPANASESPSLKLPHHPLPSASDASYHSTGLPLFMWSCK